MVEHDYPTGGMSLESSPEDMMAQSFHADDDLVRLVIAGETACFEDLMLRHRNHVRRIVGNHVPHDRVAEVAQEIFVKAYTGLGTYRFEDPFPIGWPQLLSAAATTFGGRSRRRTCL